MATVTQVSWIDSDEVADLVRQLQGPEQAPRSGAWELHTQPLEPPEPETPAFSLAPEPASDSPAPQARRDPFGDEADSQELDRIRTQLRELRARAQQAGVLGRQEPVPTPPSAPPVAPVEAEVAELPPFYPSTGPIGQRLSALHLWANQALDVQELVVLDEFGGLLEGSSEHVSLLISALLAWQADQHVHPEHAMAHLTPSVERLLSTGEQVTLLPVRSQYGIVSLGIISANALPEPHKAQASAALLAVVDG